jgi:hypothetical protein
MFWSWNLHRSCSGCLDESSFFTIKFKSFTYINFCHYLYLQFIDKYFSDRFIDKNSLLEKLSSIISGLSVSLSLINILMDQKTNKARKIIKLPTSFCQYFPREVCHIYNRKNTVYNSVSVFICLSVYPSVNIAYHQQNIICNSIEELTIEVTFTEILF